MTVKIIAKLSIFLSGNVNFVSMTQRQTSQELASATSSNGAATKDYLAASTMSEPKYSLPKCTESGSLLERIQQGHLMIVDSQRRNGLILYKKYHAEFAGPGAAVGGCIDLDCEGVLPVGSLLLLEPSDHEDRQKSYLIRRQWIRLTHQFTDNKVPAKRAQMILNQFETYFDHDIIAQIPDLAFAKLVGVLPHTVKLGRRKRSRGKKKSKS